MQANTISVDFYDQSNSSLVMISALSLKCQGRLKVIIDKSCGEVSIESKTKLKMFLSL